MKLKPIVLKFINDFHQNGKRPQVIECFTCGHCFWFAYILASRFGLQSEIMYDEVMNHFGCRIENEIYDVTGIVTNDYDWISWADMRKKDSLLAARIERDCILKET